MLFKDISSLELWQSFCSGRGYYEEQFCEIIWNLDLWLWRKCHLKIFFLSGALAALLLGGAEPFMQF